MKDNKRRQFLKNSSLAALSMMVLPRLAKAGDTPGTANVAMCEPTTLDFYGEGPFYTANPPTLVNNQLAEASEPGTRLIISGRVHNLDCTEFIPDCVIDVWHADNNGAYDNVGYNLRGQTVTNAQGFYTFETIYPPNT